MIIFWDLNYGQIIFRVFHSIAPNNIMLITTYLNVYCDVRPTIVPCGAPVRDCHESDVVEARANPECTNGGSTLHPECLATEKYASRLSQAEHKRMTKSLLLANGVLPYYVPTPLVSNLVEKWAGTLGMTPADRQARDQHLLDIRRKGGNRCYELEHGIFDPELEEEMKLWNKQTSERLLALSAAGKHWMQQDEYKQRLLALSAAGQHPFQQFDVHPMLRPEVVDKYKASRLAGTAKKRKKCSFPNCGNQAKKDGVCYRHGANRNARKKCSFPDCNNQAVNNGVCIRHGAIKKRKKCSVLTCTNYVQKGGFCRGHYVEP